MKYSSALSLNFAVFPKNCSLDVHYQILDFCFNFPFFQLYTWDY